MIEISESKVEKMSDYAEKMLRYGGKLMQCLEEISGGEEMGERWDEDRRYDDDRYFVFDSRSPHRIEVGASWVVSEKLPFTLSWYTILFGAADRNHKGERAYASYFEVACPFTVKTIDMKAGVGMVPWNAAATYNCGDRDFYVQNVFLNAGKTWDIKGADGMKIGIFTNLIWNPALDDVNFVGGFSFRM